MTTIYSVTILLLFCGASLYAVKRHQEKRRLIEWLDGI